MLISLNIFAQSSFELTGSRGFGDEFLNSLESNPSNYTLLKDWGLTLSYGSEFGDDINSNIYLLSLSKRFSNHSLMIRYTPGYQKEFLFSTGEIIFEDSTSQALNSLFSYKELFGSGYSYKFSDNFSAGFSVRYFTQEFETETFLPVFSDTNYLIRNKEIETANFWKADLGINYFPSEKIMMTVSSINLFNLGESDVSTDNEALILKKDKAAQFGISYMPLNEFDLNLIYETSNSFLTGINAYLNFIDGRIGAGLTAFHDEYQSPFIAGIIPSISYSNKFIGVTVSGVKYFGERNATGTFNDFSEKGLTNILNNRYSFDKAVLTLAITLNTVKIQAVELTDVEIINEIYPTLTDLYLDSPFAIGKVINLTEEPAVVKPYSRIEGINQDNIQSPEVYISGNDTVEVEFFTLIPESVNKSKTEISYADFYVSVSGDEPDDQLQKAVLVNGSNSWDGNVYNLKYFIKKGTSFSFNYTREILSRYKNELDTLPNNLVSFFKIKTIFNEIVNELVYTSDPRASAEYVQFPEETIKIKGGDCDDLSVLLSSLLESIGIQTALVDYKNDILRHVNVLVNTGLEPEEAKLITENDSKYFLRKNENGEDEIWIPVETTSLNNFNEAWNAGSEKFNKEALQKLGLATGKVEIIDI
ncbi:MAG: hypothetical protein EHM47_05165 [Ignavibacteriales bacterium]|nr:MAG: hypothetical protein EHM47_05165 [Ignavibacteriales bacterium]